jgi:hypothetical protein
VEAIEIETCLECKWLCRGKILRDMQGGLPDVKVDDVCKRFPKWEVVAAQFHFCGEWCPK